VCALLFDSNSIRVVGNEISKNGNYMNYHEVFSRFKCYSGEMDPNFHYDFLGVRTRKSFAPWVWKDENQARITKLPELSEDYFEWIDLLESVTSASGQFVMIELGAGWGSWIVKAAAALREINPQLPFKVGGVEADPVNFKLMQMHVEDNGIDFDQYRLIQSSVSDFDGKVWFAGGDWDYVSTGAFMIKKLDLRTLAVLGIGLLPNKVIQGLHKITGKRLFKIKPQRVNSISLRTLMSSYPQVDLIDMDIQGAELHVVKAAADVLDQKVKRVHIETHSTEVEIGLRKVFEELEWSKEVILLMGECFSKAVINPG
jgi:FkbM family methyltransferase